MVASLRVDSTLLELAFAFPTFETSVGLSNHCWHTDKSFALSIGLLS